MEELRDHARSVVGVDEAGRGALAGPVVAAAVALPRNPKFEILNPKLLRDSKKMTRAQRDRAYVMLTEDPEVAWATGIVSESVIDEINIREAALLAMKRAVENIWQTMERAEEYMLVVDGSDLLCLPVAQFALHKADDLVPCCSAASIIAKVTRDRLMNRMHAKYPLYGFDVHKGYGTEDHLLSLSQHGPCPIHRKTFSPVAKLA